MMGNENETDAITRKVQRKIEARRREDRSAWAGLGMFGLVGWAVTVPTVLGVLLGLWIDSHFESSRSWTLALLLAGAGSLLPTGDTTLAVFTRSPLASEARVATSV